MKINSFSRTLSLFDSIALIVTMIVGAGIFETAPLVAKGWPSIIGVILLWVLGGIISLAGALVYAELATTYPEEGGDYNYLRLTYGETVGYLFAWGRLIIVQPGSIAAMSLLFAKYFIDSLLSLGIAFSPVYLAILAVVGLTLVNSYRESQGRILQNLIATLKALCLVLIFSLIFFLPERVPLLASPDLSWNWSDLNLSIILILFTYGGWNEIAFVSTEVKNPDKNILKSLSFGVTLVCLLYVLVNLSFFYSLGYMGVLNSKNVTMDTVGLVLPLYAKMLTNLIIALACLGATHGLIFTGSRINFLLGRSYSAFSPLAKRSNPKQNPQNAYFLQGFISCIIIFLAQSFSQSIVYTTTVVWLFFFLTGASLIILRHTNPNIVRPYKVFLYPFTPILFCLVSAYLTLSALFYDPIGSGISVAILLIGLLFKKKKE